MIPNYDKVAFFYDRLARWVFGNRLLEAKTAHLKSIRPGDRVLVVGGGSGQLTDYLDQAGFPFHIDFVEVSGSMIRQARTKTPVNISIEYFQKDIVEYASEIKYNVVITNFFFDQFNQADCLKYLNHLKSLSHDGALMLYADFIPPEKARDKTINFLMYNFFRLTIGLGKVQLFDHKSIFLKEGLQLVKTKRVSSFIVSEVYRIV